MRTRATCSQAYIANVLPFSIAPRPPDEDGKELAMLLLYDWPLWLMALFVATATLAAALVGYAVFRRAFDIERPPPSSLTRPFP